MVKSVWFAGTVALLPLAAWAAAPQVLVTRDFTVTIAAQCAEGSVGCDNVLYTGVDRRSGQSLTLHGKTLMHDCVGTRTPCHLDGWRFDNHGTVYTVTAAGVLEVTRGGKQLLRQAGSWRASGAPAPTSVPADAARSASMHCEVDHGRPQPCRMTDHVDRHLVHSMRFTLPGRTVTFQGKAQTGWWSGTLDGKPAMGYELNRGHVVYSTTDLGTTFEWWSSGMQHGNY